MATSLHQQLKEHYVRDPSRHEVDLDDYRIDAIDDDGQLIEIQCASLAAIRDKIVKLTKRNRVIVVKPLARKKKLLKKLRRNGKVVSSRYSPSHQTLPYIFLELVHFTNAFPHPNMQLDILLTEQEEIRVPAKRKTWRRKHSVQDRALVNIEQTISVRTPEDLWQQLNLSLEGEFTTTDLAEFGNMPRWLAQKAAWCFRKMNFIETTGKQGNTIVYQLVKPVQPRQAA
ncbi:MAG: hypothetical protein MK102_12145 [Fuerstiella sp.]|nr:hypothetical protein [Fuerstiella sp.]